MKRVIVQSGCIMLVKTGLDPQRNEGVLGSRSMQSNAGCVGEGGGERPGFWCGLGTGVYLQVHW